MTLEHIIYAVVVTIFGGLVIFRTLQDRARRKEIEKRDTVKVAVPEVKVPDVEKIKEEVAHEVSTQSRSELVDSVNSLYE